MKEEFEFRINYDFANLLFNKDEGVDLGQIRKSVKVIRITKDDPRFYKIPEISKDVKEKYNKPFFFGWRIFRKYLKKELEKASLLHLIVDCEFSPTGEECGTIYDEKSACEICGANRLQIGPLILKKDSIPKKDVAITVGGEIVISEKFARIIKQKNLNCLELKSINYDSGCVNDYSQLTPIVEVELSHETIAGITPFDLSTTNENEIYKCPKGHTIGLNLLTEPYVQATGINNFDFFASRQKLGVKRGMIRPQPIYFCSPKFRRVIDEEKLTGFTLEIANVVN